MAPRDNADDRAPRLFPEAGEDRNTPLVTVAPLSPLDKKYTYTATEEVFTQLRCGQRVRVPFGRKGRIRAGIVTSLDRGIWRSTLRPVAEIVDPAGELSAHLIELGEWIARYYACPLGPTLAAMVPDAARQQRGFQTVREVRLLEAAHESTTDSESSSKTKSKLGQNSLKRLGAKQERILTTLMDAGGVMETDELLEAADASRASLRSLIDRGLLEEQKKKEVLKPDITTETQSPDFRMNAHQQAAVERIRAASAAGDFRALMLYGVSGSGKTEVYVHAMQEVVQSGRQSLLLLPEIALTTQIVARLAARFADVAVLHSGLTGSERSLAWESIRTGSAKVIIGTRSAVFAPCPNLGLIVVDEEQEPSYKNLRAPRYHVRDVALMRALMLKIPIVLGSATPSLETWHNALHREHYERLDLPERVKSLPMPEVQLVDTRPRPPWELISPELRKALGETLAKGEQAVLLLNRRGHSAKLACTQCGRVVRCARCMANMVLHQQRGEVICHHCHVKRAAPQFCEDMGCRGPLRQEVSGTEHMEEALREMFPDRAIRRADSDSMTNAESYRSLVQDMASRAIHILVGTQMIAKGLDFPAVSLVGVIGADAGAAATDFRAGERLFQLVAQVAGRAGRAQSGGRVIVQTVSPDAPALQFAQTHDFSGFAERELERRKKLRLPPAARLIRVVISDERDRAAIAVAGELAQRLRELNGAEPALGAEILGPHPCVRERLRGQYRHELLVRHGRAGVLMQLLDRARDNAVWRGTGVNIMIDVDPVNMV